MDAFAYMDDVSLGLMGVTASTIRAFSVFRRELEDICIVVNTSKTVALPPKGHAPRRRIFRSLKASMSLPTKKEG